MVYLSIFGIKIHYCTLMVLRSKLLKDTSLERTKLLGPTVSGLEGFHFNEFQLVEYLRNSAKDTGYPLSVTEEVSLEIRYKVVKRAAIQATGPRPQKLAAAPIETARIQPPRPSQATYIAYLTATTSFCKITH